MTGIGAVTVGERPTRVAITVAGLVTGGVAGLIAGGWTAPVVTVAAAAWLALAVAGLAQLTVAVGRELRPQATGGARPPGGSPG
jgi:hypothetical protein